MCVHGCACDCLFYIPLDGGVGVTSEKVESYFYKVEDISVDATVFFYVTVRGITYGVSKARKSSFTMHTMLWIAILTCFFV